MQDDECRGIGVLRSSPYCASAAFEREGFSVVHFGGTPLWEVPPQELRVYSPSRLAQEALRGRDISYLHRCVRLLLACSDTSRHVLNPTFRRRGVPCYALGTLARMEFCVASPRSTAARHRVWRVTQTPSRMFGQPKDG